VTTTASTSFVRQLTLPKLPDIVELHEAVSKPLPVGFVRPKTQNELRSYLKGKAGVTYRIVGGQSVRAASTPRVRNGKLSISDGPYAETKEQLLGFGLVEARALNGAIHARSNIRNNVHREHRVREQRVEPIRKPYVGSCHCRVGLSS
jgi:hypothetical protein